MSLYNRTKRNIALGMRAPSRDYDPEVLGQMQTAIEDLARRIPSEIATQVEEAAARTETEMTADGPEPANVVPPPIKIDGVRGNVADRYAREDHTHKGQPYKVVTGLPTDQDTAPDGTFCLARHGRESMWVRLKGTWVCLTHVE